MGETENVETRTVKHSIPIDILNDLLTRFIICVPESAKQNLIRICFQIELAHWFYLDFYVGNDNRLKACSIYEFAAHVFQHIPYLKTQSHKLNDILEEWKEYKQSVPTYGAIILSENLSHVLLVQSYWTKSSWSFPKGKVNEEEDPAHCAIREVLEETGFDISNHLNPEEYFESTINDQLVRLYIIKNIPMTTKFCPKTRCEIKACSWFAVTDLPTSKKDSTPKTKIGVNANAFFMVLPFVKRLKQLCNLNGSTNHPRLRHKSVSLCENELVYSRHRTKSMHNKLDADDLRHIKKRQEKKHSKKQLFSEDDNFDSNFCAPSWLNFKFDKNAIMECMP
ncbi:m7GpppN-mRNA hydrolase [Diorhabda carinulata]|uniref:m7GpppN-mRNA hydrolase n=1 Tax=Diorhabda sublineata TaxID=1163346 RepID=UPI0024E17043|nr:m7GpppN-mRNA hydrolase [Diorhabda sublineata]XP_057669445.1 m7GpppN-mRNA hydrolase [Diorhabda carinulata]